MHDWIKNVFSFFDLGLDLGAHTHLAISIALFFCFVLFVGWLADLAAKIIIVRLIRVALTKAYRPFAEVIIKNKVVHRLSHVIPATVIYMAAPLFDLMFDLPAKGICETIVYVLQKGALVYMIIAIVFALDSLLNAINQIYNTYEIARKKPITTYLQVVKIIGFICGAIIVISTILNKSPIAFFTGLGAATALLLLVFKDALLGLVASIQLSSYDMVRIGDWITMPKFDADGDVIEISLTTIKVQNFDKTISTIPTYALLDSGMQNWRGMEESGGRRIKRSIKIDMNTIEFCSAERLSVLSNVHLLKKYLAEKKQELEKYNQEHPGPVEAPLNIRKLSNVGIFRRYIMEYLKANPNIHQKGYTFLVRQLEPTETGLPIQLYVFTNDTNWVNYEMIQADIFDHLLAALPLFDLKAFQNTSGQEFTVHLKNQLPS